MKKIIISFFVIFSLINIVNAEYGDEQLLVIKIDDKITVYKITDRGENNYGGIYSSIQTDKLVNPTSWSLRCARVPEEAWRMCSDSENGFYSSELAKVSKELQNAQTDKAYYENELKDAERQASYGIILSVVLAVFIQLLFGVVLYLKMKVVTLERKISQK